MSEIEYLKTLFNNNKIEDKIMAIKKIINLSINGKNISELYHDVLKLLHIDNLELKKLVYLYIIIYSKSNQDEAIMLVNLFLKDCNDKRNLVKSLAIKNVGYLGIDKLNEYLIDILKNNLKINDDYVRKSVLLAIRKIKRVSHNLIVEKKIIEELYENLKNINNIGNGVIISNGLKVIIEFLYEKFEKNDDKEIEENKNIMNKSIDILNIDNNENLVEHINEDNDFNNILDFYKNQKKVVNNKRNIILKEKPDFPEDLYESILKSLNSSKMFVFESIINSLTKLKPPKDLKKVKKILEICNFSLNINSASIVLSISKLIIYYLYNCFRNDFYTQDVYITKTINKLQNLITKGPKIWIILKNIDILLDVFENLDTQINIPKLIISLNDPYNIKLIKLKIWKKIANNENYELILNEIIEYKKDINQHFVLKSIKTFKKIILKIYRLNKVSQIFNIFNKNFYDFWKEILKNNNYIIFEEIIIIISSIIKLSNDTDFIIKNYIILIEENYKRLISKKSRKEFLFLLGEKQKYFTKCDEIFNYYKDKFKNDNYEIQIEFIKCMVKCYINKVENSESILNELWEYIEDNIKNFNVRETAYIYWRLLNNDIEKCRKIVFYNKLNSENSNNYLIKGSNKKKIFFKFGNEIEELINQIGTVNGILGFNKNRTYYLYNSKEIRTDLINKTDFYLKNIDRTLVNKYKEKNKIDTINSIKEENESENGHKTPKDKYKYSFILPDYETIVENDSLTNKGSWNVEIKVKHIFNSNSNRHSLKLNIKNQRSKEIVFKGIIIKENIYGLKVKSGFKFTNNTIKSEQEKNILIQLEISDIIDETCEVKDLLIKFKIDNEFYESVYDLKINCFLSEIEPNKDFNQSDLIIFENNNISLDYQLDIDLFYNALKDNRFFTYDNKDKFISVIDNLGFIILEFSYKKEEFDIFENNSNENILKISYSSSLNLFDKIIELINSILKEIKK